MNKCSKILMLSLIFVTKQTLMLIKPTVGQQSIKEKEEASLIDIKPKMEWSVKEELKDVKIEPSEKDIKLGQVETFSGLRKGDLVEQLAIKSQIVHDMINQLGKQVAEEERQMAKKDEQIAEKDELIVKYQQMYEGLQKSNSIITLYHPCFNCLASTSHLYVLCRWL